MPNPSRSPSIRDVESGIRESPTNNTDETEPLLSTITISIHSRRRSRGNVENDPELEMLMNRFHQIFSSEPTLEQSIRSGGQIRLNDPMLVERHIRMLLGDDTISLGGR